jgi:outer membrane protein OmpA-like peptidoglycan-associated protein
MKRMLAAVSAMLWLPLALAADAAAGGRSAPIPLREGLTIVRAFHNASGDYEVIAQVVRIDAKGVRLTLSTDEPPGDANPMAAMLGGDCGGNAAQGDPRQRRWTAVRTVLREDLESAHDFRQGFRTCATREELYPGSTVVGVSARVLRELGSPGKTSLRINVKNAAAGLAGLIAGLGGGEPPKELDEASLVPVTLKRVEQGAVAFKVLVNDEPVELPAVHASGPFGNGRLDIWILDDPANPLALRVAASDAQLLQTIKLSYPAATSSATTRLERELAKDGRAVVYGIHFDFASDRIKEESAAVLAEIATILQHNPGWSLALEGHTDNIGGDASNLDLSKRRAAAVKQALLARTQGDPKRLQANGYGASRPKDTNDTLEGRARNRRVEIVRL